MLESCDTRVKKLSDRIWQQGEARVPHTIPLDPPLLKKQDIVNNNNNCLLTELVQVTQKYFSFSYSAWHLKVDH